MSTWTEAITFYINYTKATDGFRRHNADAYDQIISFLNWEFEGVTWEPSTEQVAEAIVAQFGEMAGGYDAHAVAKHWNGRARNWDPSLMMDYWAEIAR